MWPGFVKWGNSVSMSWKDLPFCERKWRFVEYVLILTRTKQSRFPRLWDKQASFPCAHKHWPLHATPGFPSLHSPPPPLWSLSSRASTCSVSCPLCQDSKWSLLSHSPADSLCHHVGTWALGFFLPCVTNCSTPKRWDVNSRKGLLWFHQVLGIHMDTETVSSPSSIDKCFRPPH